MHHGETLEHIIRRDKLSITEVSRRLGVSRRSVYNWFSKETLSVEIVSKVAFVLKHDCTRDFPDLFNHGQIREIRPEVIQGGGGDGSHQSVQYWKNKYIRLLEKYNDFLSENPLPSKFLLDKAKYEQ